MHRDRSIGAHFHLASITSTQHFSPCTSSSPRAPHHGYNVLQLVPPDQRSEQLLYGPYGQEEDMPQKLVRSDPAPQPSSSSSNNITEEKDLVIIGGGVAGYVAAIKAGQEGLSVSITLSLELDTRADNTTGSMHRQTRRPRRNMLKRRLHPLQVPP